MADHTTDGKPAGVCCTTTEWDASDAQRVHVEPLKDAAGSVYVSFDQSFAGTISLDTAMKLSTALEKAVQHHLAKHK